MMARGAKETMLASYFFDEINQQIADCGFLICEHLTSKKITEQYFEDYNKVNSSHLMTAFDNVNYCLAVRK